jgi:hypothetical protein
LAEDAKWRPFVGRALYKLLGCKTKRALAGWELGCEIKAYL